MNLPDQFSKRTQEALEKAFEIAQKKNQRAIDTEHILYGVIQDGIVMKGCLKT